MSVKKTNPKLHQDMRYSKPYPGYVASASRSVFANICSFSNCTHPIRHVYCYSLLVSCEATIKYNELLSVRHLSMVLSVFQWTDLLFYQDTVRTLARRMCIRCLVATGLRRSREVPPSYSKSCFLRPDQRICKMWVHHIRIEVYDMSSYVSIGLLLHAVFVKYNLLKKFVCLIMLVNI